MSQSTRFKKHLVLVMAAALLFFVSAFAQSDEVARWNRIATDATVAAQIDPLTESRLFSILTMPSTESIAATSRIVCRRKPRGRRPSTLPLRRPVTPHWSS